ncbi:hypothetical protein VBD025_15165 [Virgibacillus flavescens]|uniref:hypothetical protein n=1 Tax=Virgibacillus flavescens TaxID=1611422 RepID=UPI003D335A99
MKKIQSRVLFFVMALSILLNVFFVFLYYQEQDRKKDDLLYAVENVSRHMNHAAERLTAMDEGNPDNRNLIIDALRGVAISEGWIRANETVMPQNLASWIGGMKVGLSSGAFAIGKAELKSTAQDIINFNNGYHKEIKSINSNDDPYKLLEIMEDVLSSKKYMGDNFIYK